MAKDPAFLFYPGDWLGGTMTFSRSHKGAYMDLLMVQFNNGHMSLQDIETVLGPDFATMWESKLKAKFLQDEKGFFYNQKLENEVNKRKNFTDSRKKNLSHTAPHKEPHMPPHMENGNENGNTIEVKEKGVQGKKDQEVSEHPYIQKIKSDYLILLKMKEPLTQAQAVKLEADIGHKMVYETLEAMANWPKINTKCISTNLTVRRWVKKSIENGKSTVANSGINTAQKTGKFGRVSADDIEEYGTRPILTIPH